jgi:hypothetical protein
MENGAVIPMSEHGVGIARTAQYLENIINERADDWGMTGIGSPGGMEEQQL